MINRGPTTKPYEPYTGGKPSPSAEYPQEITSCGENGSVKIDVTGKNLLNIDGETSKIRGDYEIYDNKITTITKDNYSGSYLMFSEKIPKGKYRFTCNKTKKGVKQKNKVLLSVKAKTDESSTGNSFNSYYKEWLIVEYFKKDILFETFEDFQIGLPLDGDNDEVGDEIIFENAMLMREDLDLTSAYEPYKKIQAFTLSTPNGLLGLKVNSGGNYTDETGQRWICDEIDLARGKYIQRIAKYACTGKENIFKSFEDESIIEYMFHAEGISSNVLYESNGLSTHYEYLNARKGGTCTIGAGKYAYIRYNVADNVTPAQIQEFYRRQKEAGTPVTFYYILDKPVETDLPAEIIAAFKQLHTNHHTTIITNNADAGIELTYTVDTQSYIDSKIAEISTAIVQKGI